MIPYLRLYDSSIYNYLRYEVIPLHFSERVENDLLVYDAKSDSYVLNSKMQPSPVSTGRGFVLFDEDTVNGRLVANTTSEQASQVAVSGPSVYDIDYVNGRILNADSPPTSISYRWYYVSFIQGWPGSDPPPLPCVALDIETNKKAGYQLGGGSKDTVHGAVHVFATSEAEKKDITDTIYQAMYNRTISIRNWHEGSYLDYDGTYTGFVPGPVEGVSNGFFKDVTASYVSARLSWSELNRYRSKLDFVFEVYKD